MKTCSSCDTFPSCRLIDKKEGNYSGERNRWGSGSDPEVARAERAYLGGEGDVLELAVPVVLALDHGPPVHLAGLELHRHHVARRLVEQLHGDSQAPAHLPLPVLVSLTLFPLRAAKTPARGKSRRHETKPRRRRKGRKIKRKKKAWIVLGRLVTRPSPNKRTEARPKSPRETTAPNRLAMKENRRNGGKKRMRRRRGPVWFF